MLKSLVVKLKTIESGTDDWSKAAVQRGKAFLSHVRVVAFYAKVLSNVRGVAFYVVPHAGSTKFVEYVKKLLTCNKRDLGRIMDNIEPRQGDMEELSVHFDEIVKLNNITIYVFCEGRPMGKLVRM